MGNQASICNNHADCCDGFNFFKDQDINQTFACTHHYCYPNGTQPINNNCSTLIKGYPYGIQTNGTNASSLCVNNATQSNDTNCSTNPITIVYDAPNKYGFNLTEQIRINGEQAAINQAILKQNIEYPFLLGKITAIVSITMISIVLMIYTFMSIYQPILAKKCSIKLAIAMIISDMLYCFGQLFTGTKDDWQCTTIAALQVWPHLCSLFYSIPIGINLVRIAVFEAKNTARTFTLYFISPILASGVLLAIQLSLGFLGWSKPEDTKYDTSMYGRCTILLEVSNINTAKDSQKKALSLSKVWGLSTSWIYISIIVCVTCIVIFYAKLVNHINIRAKYEVKISANAKNNMVNGTGNDSQLEYSKEKEIFQKTAIRTSLYLFVPLICSFPYAIHSSNQELFTNIQLKYFSIAILSLKGCFEALIFLIDPSVIFCIKSYRSYLSKKYVVQYHSIDDSGRSTDIPSFENKGISVKWKKRIFFRRPVSLPGKISWPFLSYYIVRIFIFRKKDLASNESKGKNRKSKSKHDHVMEDKNQIKIVKYSKKIEDNDDNLEAFNENAAESIEKDQEEELLALNNIDI